MNTTTDWERIRVYNAAGADQAKTILNLFESELPESVKKWLQVEYEVKTDARIEAENAVK